MMIKYVFFMLTLIFIVQGGTINHGHSGNQWKCSGYHHCPPGYTCSAWGRCEAIWGYCTHNSMCSGYDGVCSVPSYTNCNYCDEVTSICLPGCVSDANCPDGFDCTGFKCIERASVVGCTDNFCNEHLPSFPVCDVENVPYTNCFYCEGNECKPGCTSDDNCPPSQICNDHKCAGCLINADCPEGDRCNNNICVDSPSTGVVLINSITVKTKSCDECDFNNEGVSLTLMGQVSVGAEDGLPCTALLLDHSNVNDFVSAGLTKFGGGDDEETMGGCYEAPLNGELMGGTMFWTGAGIWTPAETSSVCVDWSSNTKFAWSCDTTPDEGSWNLINCRNLAPNIKCDQDTPTPETETTETPETETPETETPETETPDTETPETETPETETETETPETETPPLNSTTECSINADCVVSPGSGVVLINSITVETKSCDGCDSNNEGVFLALLGQDGQSCTALRLDHPNVEDFSTGLTKFAGEDDEVTMGGCYEAPLNGELKGGAMSWIGAGNWTPVETSSVCVDWSSNTKFAWSCDVTPDGIRSWSLVDCKNLGPKIKCDQDTSGAAAISSTTSAPGTSTTPTSSTPTS